MSISSATKSLAEDIEASHATRSTDISDLFQEMHQHLDTFKREHQEMADSLKNELSSFERDRTQEFVSFMDDLKEDISTLEHDTQQMLHNFRHTHQEQANALRQKLSANERERKQAFADFRRNLREHVATTIADITTDHRQARSQWTSLHQMRTTKRSMH